MIMRVDRPSQSPRSPASGFTMVEMMITVVILAVLLALAVPSMREMIARKRVESIAKELASDLRYLRSIQIQRQRNERVAIRFSESQNPSMTCYSLFAYELSLCDCANTSTLVCPSASQTEFKTVIVPRNSGVELIASEGTLSWLQLGGVNSLPVLPTSTLRIRVTSSLGGELVVWTNGTAAPSICSASGHSGAYPPCS